MDANTPQQHKATWRIIVEARADALEAEADAAMRRRRSASVGKQSAASRTGPSSPDARPRQRRLPRWFRQRPPADEQEALRLTHKQITRHLSLTRAYLQAPRWGRAAIASWWRGNQIEGAWFNLHIAKGLYVRLIPDDDLVGRVPAIVTSLRSYLPKDHPQLVAVESRWKKVLDGSGIPDPGRRVTRAEREELDGALRAAYEHNARAHQQVRKLRNILLASSAVIFLLLMSLITVGVMQPSAVALCFPDTSAASPSPTPTATAAATPVPQTAQVTCPTGARAEVWPAAPTATTLPAAAAEARAAADVQADRSRARWDVALVALLGLVGAAIATILALSERTDTATPYHLQVPRALLKAVTGALTGVLGLLFLRAGVVPGFTQLDTQSEILVYAVLFGYGQQLLTGIIDTRAKNALQAASSTTPAARASP